MTDSDVSSSPSQRKHITVACNACRTRKLKCNGDRPTCTGCQDRGTACVYDAETDTTRAVTLKRKYEILEKETKQLRSLVGILQRATQAEVDIIISSLRSGQSLQRILGEPSIRAQTRASGSSTEAASLSYLDHFLDTDGSSRLQLLYPAVDYAEPLPTSSRDQRMQISALLSGTIVNDSHEIQIRAPPLDVIPHRLLRDRHPIADDRLLVVKPELWTNVQISNIQLANIISIYLSWCHSNYHLFDQALFVEDLVAGGGPFVSPAMINALCVLGCTSYGLLDSSASDLARQFLEQAQLSWAQEKSRIQASTVLAACLLNMASLAMRGQGRDLIYHGYHVAVQLGIFRSHKQDELPADPVAARITRANASAGWAVFSLAATTGLYYAQGPLCPREPSLPPTFPGDSNTLRWESWPAPALSPGYPQSRFKEFASMSKVINDCVLFRQHLMDAMIIRRSRDDPTSYKLATLILQKLVSWNESLPPEFQRHTNTRRLPPYVLELHMMTHAIIVESFRPFSSQDRSAAQLCAASLKQLAVILYQSKQWWGPGSPHLSQSPGLLHKIAFGFLYSISPADPQAEVYFLECVDSLDRISQCTPIARGMLKSLLTTAEEQDKLPPAAKIVLDRLKEDDVQALEEVDSGYIADLEIMLRRLDIAR
ncbi:hypothetical protein CAC42_7314 [Sphaceloma murrayae]|uniref:Zn(2)-C6 fungal-type domain-containing protein n=1 Tax=Sphaceloma murrayae TaxID=2082308 RepID=A0A2K1QWX4_9PEZI|nr:hypothetical protein CAC42_7314 [Sphaceloma murrayae]